jgi:hypothetical protein
VEVGHALAEEHQRRRENLYAGAFVARRVSRQLEHVGVEEREIIVILHVVHDFGGRGDIASGLATAVRNGRQRRPGIVGARHDILAQRPGEPHAHHVGNRRGGAAIHEPQVAPLRLTVIAGVAAANGIARAITEGGNAAAIE